ncbi:hypothetical protein ACFLRQ_00600 [Bacteroidota bacterium]
MNTNNKIKNKIPSNSDNPFRVPPEYFENLQERVMENIRKEENSAVRPISRKLFLRPYIALAASISGLALIIYVVLQSVIGTHLIENDSYDLALLEKTGIMLDESVVAETFNNSEESAYSDWEEEAMIYLASNEVDLIHLLESN